MLIKHAFQISVLAITFAVTAAVDATAQSYPTRPITIIVPFPPGGNSDLVIRHLADRLSVSLNQPVIVENRAGGAGGTVGTRAFANANPDGYTLLFIPPAPLVTAPLIYKNLGYDPVRSFAPVAMVFSIPQMLVINPTLPVKSMEQLVSHAKANKKDQFCESGIWNTASPAGRNVEADDRYQHCPRSLQGACTSHY